jgi:hypothetical protein
MALAGARSVVLDHREPRHERAFRDRRRFERRQHGFPAAAVQRRFDWQDRLARLGRSPRRSAVPAGSIRLIARDSRSRFGSLNLRGSSASRALRDRQARHLLGKERRWALEETAIASVPNRVSRSSCRRQSELSEICLLKSQKGIDARNISTHTPGN